MQRKLRIAMGTVYPVDDSRIRGGVEAVAVYLVQALARRDDVDLHVVSCNSSIARSFEERREGFTLHWLRTGKRLNALRAATLDPARVRSVYRTIQPDVIHAQDYSAYALAIEPPHPSVVTLHGVEAFDRSLQHQQHFRGAAGMYRRIVLRWTTRESIRRAQGLISIAADYLPTVLGHMLDGKAVFALYNPISDAFFGVDGTVQRREPVVLYAGIIDDRKNILGLVTAFARVMQDIPGVQLRLAGGVQNEQYYQTILQRVTELGIGQHVHFLGALNQEALVQEYSGASLLALNSVQETAPIVIAQAMAAGIPSVATRVGGVPSMVQDGVTGFLVASGDEASLAARMVVLLQDEPLRIQLGTAARRLAQHRYGSDKVADQTVAIYRQLLERRD
ncbi:MAG: glycosyltransferase [Herpetosiphon sp.]